MFQTYSRNKYGTHFSPEVLLTVWQKGRIIPNYSPNEWRSDSYGNILRFQDYGNTNSAYGWEVDHIHPLAKGGGDYLHNLQPLYWQTNRRKGDHFPWFG